MFTLYDWIYGISQFSAGFIALAAIPLTATIFHTSRKRELRAWIYLFPAVILFSIEAILGALSAFGITSQPLLTQTIPSIILGCIIAALITQLQINKGCTP